MLVNARIERFVSFRKYSDDSFIEMFEEAGIEIDIKQRPPFEITYLD
jgi:dCMP deaminase